MSVPVGGSPVPAAPATAAPPPRPARLEACPVRPRRGPHRTAPPRWAWPACVAAVLVTMAWFSRGGFFFWDDFIYLEQARRSPLSLDFLRLGIFDHFSPVMRGFTYLAANGFSSSWTAARLLMLGLLAAAVLTFAALARTLFGTGWIALLLTLAFGESLFVLRLLQWWSSSAQILAGQLLLLLTLLGYVRHRATGRRRDLGLSLVGYCVALLAWEQAMMALGYLVLIRLLILEDRASLAGWARALWRERWTWLAYTVPTVLCLVNYHALYYQPQPPPTAAAFLDYLRVAVADTFLPAAVGVWRPLEDLGASRPVLLAAGLAVPALVVCTLARRPRAWRAWTFFAIAAAANAVVLGRARVSHIGPVAAGHELNYQQGGALLLLLAAGFALHPRYAGGLRRRRGPRLPTLPPRAAPLCLAGALALYQGLFAVSAGAMGDSFTFPRESRAYFDRLLPELGALRAQGRPRVLVGGSVPYPVVPAIFLPANRYEELFPIFDADLRFNETGGPLHRVDPHGHLVPVRFDVAQGLDLSDPGRAPVRIHSMERVTGDGRLCLRSTGARGAVEVPLLGTVSGPGLYVHELYTVDGAVAVSVTAGHGTGWDRASSTATVWFPGSTEGLDRVAAASASGLLFEGFPAGRLLCLRRLEIGRLVDLP